jgi:hypothetical protein
LLVGLLVLVLIAMQMAGNPDNWRWMGFESNQPTTDNAPKASDHPRLQANVDIASSEASGETTDASDEESDPIRLADVSPDFEGLQLDFWTRLVRRLDDASRRTLYTLVLNDSEASASMLPEARRNLAERIDAYQRQYTAELLTQSDQSQLEDAQLRQKWYDLLFEWQKKWREDVEPWLTSLSSPAEFSAEAERSRKTLRLTLQSVARSLVMDHAPLGRPIEVPYWNVLLAQLREGGQESAEPESVTPVQLQAQPATYRGRWIAIEGTIRAARQQPLSQPSHGFENYWELWVQPDDGSSIPFCVLALRQPDGLPPVGPTLVPTELRAGFEGLFFKNRSYLTESGQTQRCPVLISTHSQVISQGETPAERAPPSVASFLLMALVLLMLVGWFVWRIHRTSRILVRRQTPQAVPTLSPLADDPTIQSVSERLRHWNPLPESSQDRGDED